MSGKLCRSITAIILAGFTAMGPMAPVHAQDQSQGQTPPATGAPPATAAPASPAPALVFPRQPDFTHPHHPWPNVLLPYTPFHVDEPTLTNSPRIQQLIHDGKLELSIEDALELALENNVDIQVQRYFMPMADTDILRTKGGGTGRGVSSVSTPSPFATIPTITFDPTVTSTLSIDNRMAPVNNPLTSGVGTAGSAGNQALHTSTGLADFLYTQGFHTGTTAAIAFNNTRSATSSPAVRFDPDLQSVMSLTISQQLLNGFSKAVNERYIRVAILARHVVDYAFEQTLITDLTAVQNDYWELVFARGNVAVQQHAVDLAQQLYDDNQKQVQVGTMAPLEIVQAQAQVATAQQALINAQTVQLQDQTLLMSVITKNPTAPELLNVEIVPTEGMQTPPPAENVPLADLLNQALAARPDVIEAKLNLNADDINVHATREALLPILTASAFASGTGLDGNQKLTTSSTVAGTAIVDAAGNPVMVLPSVAGPAIPIFQSSTKTTNAGIQTAGWFDSMAQVFQGIYPEFTFQLSLNLPIRNRVAQADNARALLTQRQDQTRLQATVNNVDVDVQNAQIVLRQDRAALTAAQTTRELQQETLDAEQKKLAVGASNIFTVVTDQQSLEVAAAAEVRAQVNLQEAEVNFERAMARTLDAHNITIANAQSGTVPHDTLIPGTTVTGELVGEKSAAATSTPATR